MKTKFIYLSSLLFFISCSSNETNYYPIPFSSICNDKEIPDGKFSSKIIYFDKNMDTLKNLKAYEYQWIIIKKNQVQDVDWDFHLPGEATTDPEGKMQLIEAPKIKFCSIEGYSKEPFEVTFKSKDE